MGALPPPPMACGKAKGCQLTQEFEGEEGE